MAHDLFDAVYGCLVAGAIGDALGAPVEGWYWHEIRAKYGKLERFLPFEKAYTNGAPGTVTDDTVLRQILCLAIARTQGRVTPDDYAAVWLEKMNPNRLWLNERIILDKLRIGMNPWDTGKGQPPCGCASMAIAPIGIINAGDPAQAYQDAFNIAFINQDDINRDGAATLAAGVAAAFAPDASVDSILDAMFTHASFVYKRALELNMDLAYASQSVDEFAEKFYARMLDWTWPSRRWTKEHYFSGSSIEIVPQVAAILYLCKGDVNQCIIEGANFGRDCDTIGSIVGSITGAMHGASAIRPEWIEAVEKANEEYFLELEGDAQANFHSMALRLVEALKSERAAKRAKLNLLDRIIAS